MITGFVQISLDEIVEQLGEGKVKTILSQFSCPYNKDIVEFIRNKAILFSNQGIAKTQLIFASYKQRPVLVAYYTLAQKTIIVRKKVLSRTKQRRLTKFAQLNKDTDSFILNAPLIAQLSKNFTNGYNKLISGDELLKIAFDKLKEGQQIFGGKITYVECEDVPVLTEFYSKNGFYKFGERLLDKEEENDIKGKYYIQMMKYF